MRYHALVNHCYCHTVGCTKDAFGYCKMICGGHMDRSDALEQEEAMLESARDFEVTRRILEKEVGFKRKETARLEPFLERSAIMR